MKDNKKRLFVYPIPDDIVINEADFKLHLQDFGKANRNKITWRDILIFVPAWAVLFTADFKSVLGIDGLSLKGFYVALVAIGTLSYSKKISWHIKYFFSWLWKKIKKWFSKKERTKDVKLDFKLSDYCKQFSYISNPTEKVEAIKTIIKNYESKN